MDGQQPRQRRQNGGLKENYDLMNGMFDNECMQWHLNAVPEEEQ